MALPSSKGSAMKSLILHHINMLPCNDIAGQNLQGLPDI